MTASRAIRAGGPILLALLMAGLVALLVDTRPAAAFQVESRGTAGLDGKIVMSPAAERIETIEPDSGDQIGPGSKVVRAIIIHNRSKQKVDFDLDVAQVVGSNSELIVEVRHGVREGAAAWVTLERNTLTLKPGQQGTVLVTINIPKGIKPGSKPFAVTATQRGGQVQTEGAGIAPQFKQVAIFIAELPGDAATEGKFTKASLTSVEKSLEAAKQGKKSPDNERLYVGPGWTKAHTLTLSTEYENKGERLLTPTGKVVVKDIFGRVAGRYEIKKFTVYPEGEGANSVQLKGLPSLGIFQVRIEVESEAGKQTTTLPRFVSVPKWFPIVIGAFLLYGLQRLLRWQLRRRREWKRYLAEEVEGGAGADGSFEDAWVDADDDAEAWNETGAV